MHSLLDQLRELRRSHGYSQRELARWCDMHQNEVSRLENGKQAPRLERVERIAEALGAELVLVRKQDAAMVRDLYGVSRGDVGVPLDDDRATGTASNDDWQASLRERYHVDLDDDR